MFDLDLNPLRISYQASFAKRIQALMIGNSRPPWVKNITMAIRNPGGDKPLFQKGGETSHIASQFTSHPLFKGASEKKTP